MHADLYCCVQIIFTVVFGAGATIVDWRMTSEHWKIAIITSLKKKKVVRGSIKYCRPVKLVSGNVANTINWNWISWYQDNLRLISERQVDFLKDTLCQTKLIVYFWWSNGMLMMQMCLFLGVQGTISKSSEDIKLKRHSKLRRMVIVKGVEVEWAINWCMNFNAKKLIALIKVRKGIINSKALF